MKEITKFPIEGIGIISLENDPMKYIVNIKLMEGPYKNYCVQLLLTFPDSYPTNPPKILIYPNQAIDNQYHHHIFQDSTKDENGSHFKKFCFDLLDNDFMSTKDIENTGWNPSYSITFLLLQVQNFLCDPDMNENIPDKNKIKQLMDSMDSYERQFIIENTDGKKEIKIHTWNKPYPEMYFKNKVENKDKIKEENEKTDENTIKLQRIKENLTCFMLKVNYIDDPDILLGYPIIQSKAKYGKNKIELFPIPELLTYEGFMSQIGNQDIKLDYYFDIKFKSANNQFYNYWIPIYINENHYKKNRTAILNSFSVIKYGPLGIKEYDFKPEHIFEILPILLNNMIIGSFRKKVTISKAFMKCYFQYVLLFKELCLEFKDEYSKYVNNILTLIQKNNYDVSKTIVPDIGNLFILLFFSNSDIHSENMKEIWNAIFEESATRKIFWMFHEEEMRLKMKKLFFKNKKILHHDICFKLLEEDNEFDIVLPDQFIEDLKNKKIYNKIVDIINKDINYSYISSVNYSSNFILDDDFFESFDPEDFLDFKEKRKYIEEKMYKKFKEL